MMMTGYYDISPEISPHIAVFPGDTPYRRDTLCDFAKGDNMRLSKITTTPHAGAHADAPCHYHPDGCGMGERSLHYYYGACQVVEVQLPRGARILPEHLRSTAITRPRVLFKTGSFPQPNLWNSDFNALSADLIDFLGDAQVCLVGIDTPSVDLCADKDLEVHRAIYRHDMANLEGIDLAHVPAGFYHLTALPLRLRDADASPVKAVLWNE